MDIVLEMQEEETLVGNSQRERLRKRDIDKDWGKLGNPEKERHTDTEGKNSGRNPG